MQDYHYIRQLLVKDHFGELSKEEQIYLNHLLLTDPETRHIQQEMLFQDIPEAETATQQLDLEYSFEQMLLKKRQYARRVRRKKIVYATSIAATLIGVFIFIWQTPRPADDQLAQKPQEAVMSDKAILLTSGGKQIILEDSGKQMLNINGVQLSNNNRVLHVAGFAGNAGLKGWNTITVPPKLDYRIELADGSTVWLNSTTKLRFPFSFEGTSREVYIEEGEAYFSVKGNSANPFVVHTNKGDVHVLGTEFNINNYSTDKVTTSLVNGSVLISAGSHQRKLAPSQEAVVSRDDIAVKTFDVTTTTSWRHGMHYFNDASVAEIASMLSRWFDEKLIIDDPAVSNIRFHASMNRNKPLSFFVETMNLTGEAYFYVKDGMLHCKLP